MNEIDKQYWILSNPLTDKFVRLRKDKSSLYFLLREDKYFQDNRYIFNSPIPHISETGKKLAEILWPFGIHPRCISNRLLTLFESAAIKGFVTYPVSIRTPNGKEIPGYTGIYIIGQRVNLDFSQSKIIERPLRPGSNRMTSVYVNISIDYSQVDNRDIFLSQAAIMISEKLHQILTDNAVQNVKITSLTDWELDSLVVKYIPK
jgi:hypothetical protein